MNDDSARPWLLLGDFNFILHALEKQGGNPDTSLAPAFVRNKLVELRLNEVFSFGNPYTWCNRRFKNPSELIFEKLDRGFMNDDWVSVVPHTRITNLARVYSDHNPILLKCFHNEQTLSIPYKFFKCWQLSPDFKNVLINSWDKKVNGSPSFVVSGKLKNLKTDLSKWNIESFGHIKNTTSKLNVEIEKLQAMPFTSVIGDFILNYSKKLDYWYEIENSFYKKKSRIDYFTHYDKNTQFFHNTVKLRNMYNTIHTIKDDQGDWLENIDQVLNHLSQYFKKIYTSSKPTNNVLDEALKDVKPIITEDMNTLLVAIPTVEEIQATVNDMTPWKSAGPDGFPSAFIANRQIHDNITISHEILHFFKRKKKTAKNGFMIIKLDLSKAFDRLEWSFILSVFQKLGFSEEWCQIIDQCISTVSYSIIVNGYPGEMFFPTRGKDKRCGGLGIRNTYATNRVFIAKLGWQILQNPDHLISKFLKDKYFINQNLLEIDKASDSTSWIWKGIVNSLYFLRSNIVFKINDGASTRIRDSVWLPGTSSPPVSHNLNFKDYTYINELIDNNSGTWNLDLLNSLFLPEDVIMIRTVRVNLLLKDQIMWAHTKNGTYTIKTAYRVYKNENSNGEEALFWKKHLINFDLDWTEDYFLEWFDDRLGQPPFVVNWPSIAAIVMWCIWKLRCKVVFSKVTINLDKVILDVKRMINTYIAPPVKIHKTNLEVKLPINLVDHCLFIDGSFKKFNMGVGLILCDNAGTITHSRSDFGLISDVVSAEATALFFGHLMGKGDQAKQLFKQPMPTRDRNFKDWNFGDGIHQQRQWINGVPWCFCGGGLKFKVKIENKERTEIGRRNEWQ
ncbi:uncharacterized protein LOC113295570 [Papaver somniferum]|uniref:uncharacterized protein LOC113295570 n=1 Tax=Papaver somniferum TaxID=3469 RepID=UPI000E70333F|nr:uncharacterized protein LOC113295570 [Papaver somniferum]